MVASGWIYLYVTRKGFTSFMDLLTTSVILIATSKTAAHWLQNDVGAAVAFISEGEVEEFQQHTVCGLEERVKGHTQERRLNEAQI